jgi:hypothetical protein
MQNERPLFVATIARLFHQAVSTAEWRTLALQ